MERSICSVRLDFIPVHQSYSCLVIPVPCMSSALYLAEAVYCGLLLSNPVVLEGFRSE